MVTPCPAWLDSRASTACRWALLTPRLRSPFLPAPLHLQPTSPSSLLVMGRPFSTWFSFSHLSSFSEVLHTRINPGFLLHPQRCRGNANIDVKEVPGAGWGGCAGLSEDRCPAGTPSPPHTPLFRAWWDIAPLPLPRNRHGVAQQTPARALGKNCGNWGPCLA